MRDYTPSEMIEHLHLENEELREGIAALAESNRILASQADEAEALRAALTEARAELAATRNLERMRTLLADARRERDEARRALEDVQAILAEPGTPPKSVWRAWQARHPAALGRPAPDGEPHSAT